MADKTIHGSASWFGMVGGLLEQAALQAKLSRDFNFCFVERYIDGAELGGGLVQGLRFEIIQGKPSFRGGVRRDERGDITVEITVQGSRILNTLYGADPKYRLTIAHLKEQGQLTVDGNFLQLGHWFHDVHDHIVERTR